MVKPMNSELPITGFLIGNLFGGMFYWCMDQTNVQRVLGARSVDQGQKGAIFAGFLKLLIPFILVLPGVIAHALYPNLAKADMAYPRLVSDLLPVGLRGLVLAGLIAILMSSMSACYNASATLVVRDFFMRWKPGLSDRDQVVIGRRVTVLMAVLGVLAAPLVGLSVTIWHYLQMLSAYLGVPLGAVIFIGLLWKRGNTAGAIAGGAAGFAFGLFLFLERDPRLGAGGASLSGLVPPSFDPGVVLRGDYHDCGQPSDCAAARVQGREQRVRFRCEAEAGRNGLSDLGRRPVRLYADPMVDVPLTRAVSGCRSRRRRPPMPPSPPCPPPSGRLLP